MLNAIIRSTPCPECGAEMHWAQNAWKTADSGSAAYCCVNGHVLDPAQTRQCPSCGVHDTALLGERDGLPQFRCARCGETFTFPH